HSFYLVIINAVKLHFAKNTQSGTRKISRAIPHLRRKMSATAHAKCTVFALSKINPIAGAD
ncbi:unnamed protein product, partial [Staurois parvus]